jgi:hypothetical protein
MLSGMVPWAAPMSWSLEFDEPIVLANCQSLRTLRDAGDYVAALSKKEANLSHWQVAASCLLSACDKGGDLVVMARIAMVQALQASKPQPKQPPRWKRTKQYRIVSWMDGA